MAESLMVQTFLGFSTAPESSYGDTGVNLASLFTAMETLARILPIPDQEKIDNRGAVGKGTTTLPTSQRSGFTIPTAFEINHRVNTTSLLPLLRRFMGAPGVAPTVVEASKAWKHVFTQINPDTQGLQLPSSSFIYQNNEMDFVHYGMCGSTFNCTQAGTADPTFTLGLVGSGLYQRIAAIASFGALALPVAQTEMYGTSSKVQYTNTVPTTVSLTTPLHKMKSINFSANNNLVTGDTRAGMPQVDAAEPRRGWYRDFLHYGDRDATLEFTQSFDTDNTLFDASNLNSEFTNFIWEMNGDYVPTSTINKQAVLIVIPKFTLRTPRATEDNNKMAKSFAVVPQYTGTMYGGFRIEAVCPTSSTIA